MPLPDRLALFLAWKLPRRLVYWCAVRVMAHAAHKLPTKEVPALTPSDCLEAWNTK